MGALVGLGLLCVPGVALAEDGGAAGGAAEPEVPDEGGASGTGDPLSPYRTPFGVLVDRSIGSTSTAVAFNWRRTRVQIGATGNFLFELNNFNSMGAGVVARFPSNGLMMEVGLGREWVWDTPSSQLLALTPYRQPGRPRRFDLSFNLGIPLAEGVVTARPRFFPAAELVFSAYTSVRYAFYPMSFSGMRPREVGGALLSPALTDAEIDNLETRRLDAMQVDPGRYGLLVGLGNDIYFKQGVFVAPRVLVSVPLLVLVNGSELYFWGEVSLSAGVAF